MAGLRRPALSRSVGVIALVQFALLLAASTRYGYHRDELYFIVAGSHPAFGYPDQPPVVPLLCAGLNAIWHSLFLLRLPSALASGSTTVLSALVARELGGARRAQVIAGGCTASSGFALAVGHFVTTTTLDLLSTTALLWLVIRAIVRRSGPSLLALASSSVSDSRQSLRSESLARWSRRRCSCSGRAGRSVRGGHSAPSSRLSSLQRRTFSGSSCTGGRRRPSPGTSAGRQRVDGSASSRSSS